MYNSTANQIDKKPISKGNVIAKTIEGRLLSASQCAYEIQPLYFRAAGFLSGSSAKRISRSINSVLIGRTIDGIVLAFRGTVNSFLDWFQNIATAVLVSPFQQGKVHGGFYQAVKSLWSDGIIKVVRDLIAEARSKGESENIYLTGHSKGGALAILGATMFTNMTNYKVSGVHVFGSPRVGDAQFREWYNSKLGSETFAYENHLDPIPFLPPSPSDKKNEGSKNSQTWPNSKSDIPESSWGYQSVGKRRFIKNGKIINNVTRDMDNQRIYEFEQYTLLKFDKFRDAHSSDCNGAYFQTIAPEICNKINSDHVV